MRNLIVTITFLLVCHSALTQDTTTMFITTAGLNIGKTQFINHKNKTLREHYQIKSDAQLFGFYKVSYLLEAWYSGHNLDSSIAYYKINNHTKHHCIIQKKDSSFHITRDNNKTIIIPIPKSESYCKAFFSKEKVPEILFSEYDGELKKINYTNDSTFQILDSHLRIEATYFYLDSIISGGHINHALLKFNINKK